jgi:hypothetical protein
MMQRHKFKEAMWKKVGAKYSLSLKSMRMAYGDVLIPLGQDSNWSVMAMAERMAERMAVDGIGVRRESNEEVKSAKKYSVEVKSAEQEDDKQ